MFRNRGENPNVNTDGYSAPHYSHYWPKRFIIIRYDKTFIAIELISTFIILLTIVSVWLFTYQIPFEDPIASMKNTFLTAQLISILVSLIATGLVTFLTKSKDTLIKFLRIIAILLTLITIIFLGTKAYIDNKYNENAFGEFYEKYEQSNNNNNKSSNKLSINLSGIKASNPKEFYVNESINAYTNFSVKVILYTIIQILVIILLLYLSYRLSSIERKKERLLKDDSILYDEEENIKF